MKPSKRVLIVDDDSGIRRSLSRILRSKQLTTFEAADGLEAVEIVKNESPDLAILDIRMPGIDGVETFRKIRELKPSMPAIFMTAYSSSERAVAATAAGALCVLMKPLEPAVMLQVVERAVHVAPVLVVDDNEEFLRSLARSLDSAGVQTVTVSSLAMASAELRKRPDRVVIADVFLRDGNGFDLLAEYEGGLDVLPLIFVTGHADWYESSKVATGSGASNVRCLPKPLDIDSLLQTIGDIRAQTTPAVPMYGGKWIVDADSAGDATK